VTPAEALTTGFEQWLKHVTGHDTPVARISPGQPLTPYSTSMRVTKPQTEWLTQIERKVPLAGDATQKYRDLRAAGLLPLDQTVRLSSLGRTVLTEWRRLQVDDANDGHEVVRAATLCRLALRANDQNYRQYMRFWIRLRELRPPEDWFNDLGNLILVTYLHRTDQNGYNPFLVLTGLAAGFPDFTDWQDWAAELPTPPGWKHSRLGHLMNRVTSLHDRSRGLRTYCQAMEAVFLAVDQPAVLPAAVTLLARA